MAEYLPERKSSSCVSMIYGSIFRRRSFWPRRSASTNSLHIPPTNNNVLKTPSSNSKRRRSGSDEASFLDPTNNINEAQQKAPPVKPILIPKSASPNHYQDHHYHGNNNTNNNNSTSSTNASRNASNGAPKPVPVQQGLNHGRRVPKESIGISGELETMINEYQRSKGSNNTLVRASSGNVMLYSNLGNLRQPGNAGNFNPSNLPNSTTNVLDHLPMTAKDMNPNSNRKGNYSNENLNSLGNEKENDQSKKKPESLCRALSTRMDPEQLKIMGNEDYKEGRYVEALALYEAAIAIDSNKASYRSNKSAALTAIGRLLEAVFECREAIRIDPFYHRAHHRLATLYLRLGEAEKALYHYKQSGPERDANDIAHAKSLQTHLNKCTEARRLRDWNTLIKESECAISSGADSAPQIFALQAEALMKLQKHQDADSILSKSPNFDVDDCTKFFGPISNASILVVRAQVNLANGRFEDAIAMAQRAARLDSNNKEAAAMVKRTKGVASARSTGNELFKVFEFLEASKAYGEGLELDPYNSVLLCNRAACRSKLGQFEKAIEDCTRALTLRPAYTKARLRRADCYAKLERWEASMEDYEVLKRELPEDDEVSLALTEIQAKLNKQRNEEDPEDMKFSDLTVVSDEEHFRQVKRFQGISVVVFCNKADETKPALQLMERLQKKYQSTDFLKVDVEDHPELVKSEGVTTLPAFNIYKNGSKVKEIPGISHELLESTVKFYNTS